MYQNDILTEVTEAAYARINGSFTSTDAEVQEAVKQAHLRAFGGYVRTGGRVEVIRVVSVESGLIDRTPLTWIAREFAAAVA